VQLKIESTNKLYETNLGKIAELLEFRPKVTSANDEPIEKKESFVQNVQELFLILKYAGIDFGADQAHILQKSLNELAFGAGAK